MFDLPVLMILVSPLLAFNESWFVQNRMNVELISVVEAAARKGCSTQAVRDAIVTGKVKGRKVKRSYIVRADKDFSDWEPEPRYKSGE